MVSCCGPACVQTPAKSSVGDSHSPLEITPHKTGVIGDGLVTALGTSIDMTAQRSSAATLNGPKSLELLKVEAPSIQVQEAVTLHAEDIGHLYGRPTHFCRGR
jgi:hypothetical protein